MNGANEIKNSPDYPVKTLKGVKTTENSSSSGGGSGGIRNNDQKYVKLDLINKPLINDYNNKLENYATLKNEDYYYYDSMNRKSLKYEQNINENTSTTLRKSSFSLSNNRDSDHSSSNESKKLLLVKDSIGLLTTVDQIKSNNHEVDSSSNSVSTLNEPNLIMHNKMVTFSSGITNGNGVIGAEQNTVNSKCQSKIYSSVNLNKFKNQSNTTLTTSTHNNSISTATTSASSSSTAASSTSPTVSSIGSPPNEEELIINNHSNNLTVSDVQNDYNKNQTRPVMMSKFTTFGSTNNPNSNSYKSPKKFINGTGLSLPPNSLPSSVLYSNGIQNEFTDNFESRYLNKLCEDIEVSLNVDSEVVDDDYSSNDFSGDYSFDNDNFYKANYSMMQNNNNNNKIQFTSSNGNNKGFSIMKNSRINQNSVTKKPPLSKEQSMNVDGSSSASSQLGVLV